jgi:fatty acid desaturase
MEGSHMLKDQGTKSGYRWWRFAVHALAGVAAGAFSSWYIYGNVWSWPLPVTVGAFVVAALMDKRRIELR